ncbi:hypothetical protein FRB90_010460 [Tulasnella sp. 427]|nr:hypothetical protein FRB90_010460 [Tulasnella sp. 427]
MMKPRVAVITGASSGIGRASAVRLSSEGWIVILSARREKELAETASLCPGETLSIIGDISKEEDIVNLFDRTIARYGRLDLLFNNAGLGGESERIDNITIVNFLNVMNVNVIASVLCTREAFKIFKNQSPPGGRIINNGSLSATTPRPEAAAYTISKHAISGLTKSTALDGRPFNITATQIDIGNAETALSTAHHDNKGTLQADGSIKPEPFMEVSHVANAIAHIASLPNEVTLLEMTIM